MSRRISKKALQQQKAEIDKSVKATKESSKKLKNSSNTVKYPDGTQVPVMRSYNVKPVSQIHNPHKAHKKRHSKYNAKKFHVGPDTFDSKAEGMYDIKLRRIKANFSIHTKFVTRPHTKYRSRVDGKVYGLHVRSYRPDFVLYKPGKKHLIRNIIKVVDVKGKAEMTPSASQRMDAFSYRYHIPVTIARYDYKQNIFIEYIKGYRRHKHYFV